MVVSPAHVVTRVFHVVFSNDAHWVANSVPSVIAASAVLPNHIKIFFELTLSGSNKMFTS